MLHALLLSQKMTTDTAAHQDEHNTHTPAGSGSVSGSGNAHGSMDMSGGGEMAMEPEDFMVRYWLRAFNAPCAMCTGCCTGLALALDLVQPHTLALYHGLALAHVLRLSVGLSPLVMLLTCGASRRKPTACTLSTATCTATCRGPPSPPGRWCDGCLWRTAQRASSTHPTSSTM